MKFRAFRISAIALTLSVVSVPIFAHHESSAYDMSRTVAVKGRITQFDFVNPHVQVFFDATDEKGSVEKWQAELTSPNHLVRMGWSKKTLNPGDDVTVSGYRAKNGSNSIWISKILLKDQELKLTPGDN